MTPSNPAPDGTPRKPEPTARDIEDAERYIREIIPPKFIGQKLKEWVEDTAEGLAHFRAVGKDEEWIDREIRRLLADARTHQQRLASGRSGE